MLWVNDMSIEEDVTTTRLGMDREDVTLLRKCIRNDGGPHKWVLYPMPLRLRDSTSWVCEFCGVVRELPIPYTLREKAVV